MIASVIVLVVLAIGALVPTVLLQDRGAPPPETSAAGPAQPASDCTLDVVASPDIADTLATISSGFQGPDGCAVAVEPAEAADIAARIGDGWDEAQAGPLPDVWIPDSSVWVRYAEAGEEGSGMLPDDRPSIARSPTVAGMPQPMAEQLGWPDTQMGWNDLLPLFTERRDIWIQSGHPEWGPFRFGVADPAQSTAGMHALMSFGAAQNPQWAEALSAEGEQRVQAQQLLLALAGRNTRVDPSVDEQLTLLREAGEGGEPFAFLSAMPLSERDVWRYDRGLLGVQGEASPPPVPLVALYPSEGSVDFDYPYVTLQSPQAGEQTQEAAAFLNHLLGDDAQAQLQEDGFRNRDNVPGAVLQDAAELRPDQAGPQVPAPEGAVTVAALDGWERVARTGTTLAVIDVSGSMGVRVPGTDTTLLDLTIASSVRGIELFTSGSRIGLWEFSTSLPDGEEGGRYRELVPIGLVDEEVSDGVTRRQAVATALQNLELANDTALYDTTLAAFKEVQEQHDGGPLNSVVLFTDGKSDGDELSLEQLLEELRSVQDPERPVQVLAIAWGPEADVESLRAVVDVTGGEVFTPGSPEEIAEVFLKVLTGE